MYVYICFIIIIIIMYIFEDKAERFMRLLLLLLQSFAEIITMLLVKSNYHCSK